MGGFDNGTLQSGIFAQAKQFGSVLRGFGPPVPAAGVIGDLYLDVQTGFLFEKTDNEATDPWGNYLFQVPQLYLNTLKWFTSFAPTNDFGAAGDYCVAWGGYANYGLEPSIYGPKAAYGWPEIGIGIATDIDPQYAGFSLPVGLEGEGNEISFSTSTQLIVAGLVTEYILAIPVDFDDETKVLQRGLAAGPLQVSVQLNPIYTAIDAHTV